MEIKKVSAGLLQVFMFLLYHKHTTHLFIFFNLLNCMKQPSILVTKFIQK